MPTTSQFQIVSKISSQGTRFRAKHNSLAGDAVAEGSIPIYIPPARSVFSLGPSRLQTARDTDQGQNDGRPFTYFPEMVSLATLVSRPGATAADMTADDIIKRLQELGWRKEGEAARHVAEREKREEDKKRMEKESQKKQVLDIFNDPLLRRVSKKSQNLPTYTKPPESRPCAVCFDIDGPSLTHSTIMFQLNVLLEDFDDVDIKIVSLEYQPRAVHIKGHNVDNRWVVTLDSQYSVNRLSGSQLTFGSKVVTVRRYDDVLGLEFKQFTRRSNFMKMFGQK